MSVEQLLKDYDAFKKQISVLQHTEEHIKNEIRTIMDQSDTDILQSRKFKCTRTHRTRDCMLKKNVPNEIWKSYSTQTNFDTITLRKI